MTDFYAYWRDALAITNGARPLTRDEIASVGLTTEIGCGFFRRRQSRGGAYLPAAIWRSGHGSFIATVDNQVANASDEWTYCAWFPISEEQYRQRIENGKWHDEDSSIAETLAPPPSGHNNPPTDEAEIIEGQIAAAAKGAEQYAEIKDDGTAAKAQSLRSRLLELSRDADKKREALKKPHLEAGKTIDSRWQPLVKAAKSAADAIASALGAHETRKAREAAEAARKAEEARRKAEQEALKAAEAGKPAPAPVAAPPVPPVAAEPTTAIRGAYGRAAAVKEIKIATVVDQDKVYAAFRSNADVVALLAKLAQKAVDAGATLDGVTVEIGRKVV